MRILTSSAAKALGGSLVGPDAVFDGAAFDSRSLVPGQLFVALIADRDGHEFIGAAVEAGASALLVSDRSRVPDQIAAIVVDDTAQALMELATWARQLPDIPVIAVTGSVGKTSTKDLIAAALGATRRVAANERSFNNEQGLPVTILNAPDDVEALVVEMGMRGLGEIARLAKIAAPTIGVVTRVASSHTERVGGIDGVAVAKRELVEALPSDGIAILNADDDRVAAMAEHTVARVVSYGTTAAPADGVRIASVELDELARPTVVFDTAWGSAQVHLAVSGHHMASNAAAALAVVGAIEADVQPAAAALGAATISSGRMEIARTPTGAVVINDAYNANPDSTAAALEALSGLAADRRVAVLGPMAELDDPVRGHRAVADAAAAAGIELIAVGTDLYGVPPVADVTAAASALADIGPGTAVLVKASNSARLWRVWELLVAPADVEKAN